MQCNSFDIFGLEIIFLCPEEGQRSWFTCSYTAFSCWAALTHIHIHILKAS